MAAWVVLLVTWSFLLAPAASEGVLPAGDLGTLPGQPDSEATAINDAGQIAGVSGDFEFPMPQDLVLWDGDTMTDLGLLLPPGEVGTFGVTARPLDMNDHGAIVGSAIIADCGESSCSFTSHAFLWTQSDGMIDLGDLGLPTTEATGINDHGVVVGWGWGCGTRTYHAFVWTEAGGMECLLPEESYAYGVNDGGDVVGMYRVGNIFHGFLWSARAGLVDLGSLGGYLTQPQDVAGAGIVVGSYEDSRGTEHAFVWTADAGFSELPPLAGATAAEAYAVNEEGYVVGWSGVDRWAKHPVAWVPQGDGTYRVREIGSLGGCCGVAYDINDFGQIVGGSTTSDGTTHAFLTEIPSLAAGIEAVLDQVSNLAREGRLDPALASSLEVKLINAADALEAGHVNAVKGMLTATANEVQALVQGRLLPPSDGAELLTAIGELMQRLGS